MARPRKPVDPKKVERLAAVGCTQEEIAILTDVSERTIKGRYCLPFQKGHHKLRHTIKRKLIDMALEGNMAAIIFAAKVYCGLRELPENAVTVNVSASASAHAEVRSPEQIKAHLLDLQKAVREEAKRLELN